MSTLSYGCLLPGDLLIFDLVGRQVTTTILELRDVIPSPWCDVLGLRSGCGDDKPIKIRMSKDWAVTNALLAGERLRVLRRGRVILDESR